MAIRLKLDTNSVLANILSSTAIDCTARLCQLECLQSPPSWSSRQLVLQRQRCSTIGSTPATSWSAWGWQSTKTSQGNIGKHKSERNIKVFPKQQRAGSASGEEPAPGSASAEPRRKRTSNDAPAEEEEEEEGKPQ